MPLMALRLRQAVDDAIRAHGIEAYPNECCGALLGRDGLVREAFSLPNTTEEGPRRRFLVRPQDYRDAEAKASELGLVSIRPGPCVAVFLVCDPFRPFRRPTGHDLMAVARGSSRVYRGTVDP